MKKVQTASMLDEHICFSSRYQTTYAILTMGFIVALCNYEFIISIIFLFGKGESLYTIFNQMDKAYKAGKKYDIISTCRTLEQISGGNRFEHFSHKIH